MNQHQRVHQAIDALSEEITISATTVADYIRQHSETMTDAQYNQLVKVVDEVLAQKFGSHLPSIH
jgi:hypothetical protein